MMTGLIADRYELGSELGAGGMGRVYRARDRVLGRAVAIKLLHTELAREPNARQRFLNEARAAVNFAHPGAVAVYDAGVDGDQPFIAMEFVDGRSLAELLHHGPLAPGRAVAIAEQVLAALGTAHQRGLVHRDIKPANIMLPTDGGAKLADFGIAKSVADLKALTGSGQILGTPHYLSPEQASGEQATPSSDVYAMGVVLYEMLAGAPPMSGDTPIAVAMAHQHDDPPPLTQRAAVDASLAQVVHTALAKDPAARYPDGAAMRAALLAAPSWPPPTNEPTVALDASISPPMADATTHATTQLSAEPDESVVDNPARRDGSGAGDHSKGAPGRLRQWFSSARVRIVGWHILALALTLALSIVAVRMVLLVRMDERIDRELEQEVSELAELADGTDPATGEPFGTDAARILEVFLERNVASRNETFVTYVDGRPHRRSVDDPPLRLDRDAELADRWAGTTTTDRGSFTRPEVGTVMYHAVPLVVDGEARGVFVAAWFRDLEAEEIDEIVLIVAAIGIVILLFATLIVWNVTGRVLRPVRELTGTAQAITDTDLTRRIDVAGADEVANLAGTFNAMLDRLETAFAAQRQFIDDAGHELRTPITIVRGHLELLEYGDVEDRRATIALVTDELDRMHRMVEDLLLLAKAQRPDFLRIELVDLDELTREVFQKATALARRDWRLGSVADGFIYADRQRLTQAVAQLAHNATQHTEPDAGITIGSAIDGNSVRLWVADRGAGISAEDADRIFERFARVNRAGRGHDGSGLGLAIVRAITDAHGGRIEVSTTPGGGATFTIIVPSQPLPTTASTPVSSEASR